MANNDQQIAALEQRIAALEQENRELKSPPKPAPQPAPPIEEGVTVSFPRSTPIVMPTVAEFEKLLAIVARSHPNVVPKFDRASDQHEFFRGFVASFERIASLRRTIGEGGGLILNTKYDARWWSEEARRWLAERGTPAETSGAFFAAAIAAGDVVFSFGNSAQGIPPFVGLSYGDGLSASTAAWQRVLRDGQPRSPSAAPAPMRAPPSPSQVRITG